MSNLLLQGVPPYLGTKANTPPNAVLRTRRPTVSDINYSVNDFWIFNDPAQVNFQELWFLASLKGDGSIPGYMAKWVLLSDSAGGGVLQNTTDDLVQIQPILGNINIFGSTNIHTTGDIPTGTARVFLNDSILLPETTDQDHGVIALGVDLTNDRFIHNYGAGGRGDNNTFLGRRSGNFTLTGTDNTGIGSSSLISLTTGSENTAVGRIALGFTTTGIGNSAFGSFSSGNITTGDGNCAFGHTSLGVLTIGLGNVAMGRESLSALDTGNFNIAIGNFAGSAYTTFEDSNILIGNIGVATDNNTIRIGTPGVGAQTQDLCYVAGITGNTIANESPMKVVNVGTDGELGEVSLESSGGTVTITQPSPGVINFEAAGGGGGGTNPFAFSYILNSNTADVGNNVTYTMGTTVAFTQLFDVGGLFYPGDGLGAPAVFTAPVKGKYYLSFSYNVSNFLNSTLTMRTSIGGGRNYRETAVAGATGPNFNFYSVIADMAMGDTVEYDARTTVSGGGPVLYLGQGVPSYENSTHISGFLIPEDGTGGSFAQPFLGIQQVDANAVSGLALPYFLGSAAPMVEQYDTGANFDPGDGVGTGCSFTAPATGIYTFNISVRNSAGNNFAVYLYNNGVIVYGRNPEGAIGTSTSQQVILDISLTGPELGPADVVTFAIASNPGTVNITYQENLLNDGVFIPNQTFVSGHRIA